MLKLKTDVITIHSTGDTKQHVQEIEISKDFFRDLKENELKELRKILQNYFATRNKYPEKPNLDTELYWFFLTNHDEFQEIVDKFSGASELLEIELYLVPSVKLLDQVEEELDCRDWIVIE